jgi:hypothetical protein
MTVAARNPRLEAEARLGGRYAVRVLEPSPPAVDDGEFFADDPAARGDAAAVAADGRPIVGPTAEADVSWSSLSADDPELAAWCAARWLGPWPRLNPLPAGYAETREAMRRLAVYVLAPARKAVNGKIGLRYTAGGFGTPFFGADEQLRVEGAALVHQRGDTADATEITSLATVAAFTGVALAEDPGVGDDVPALGDADAPLPVDPSASAAVGAWYGFSASVLEEFRAELNAAGRACSRVQLWPEHFDLGCSIEGVNFGCSPGDGYSADPYVYVGPWNADGLQGAFWNAPFGAVLPYDALLGADDQRAAALSFLRRGGELALLRAAPQP